MNAADALASAAGIGPFFRVRVVPPSHGGPDPTLTALAAGGATLAERVAATGRALGTDEARVAGSILFQGIAARLWSPTLAVAASEHRVVRLPPDATALDDPGLACARPGLSPVLRDEGALAAELHRAVIDTHLSPLAAALDVPPTTLWGNAASAAVGSYQVMTAARPELSSPDLLAALLDTGRLAGTGRLDAAGRFDRASCCLFYRVPGGGLCGDCVLHRRGRPS